MVGLEAMDEILVLQNGRIIERGSHNLFYLATAFIAGCGIYIIKSCKKIMDDIFGVLINLGD